jgi:tRNA(fMet)-specific endonuclease VapC
VNHLIDSDRVAEYLKGIPRTVALMTPLLAGGAGISIITYAEVYEGLYHGHNPQQQEQAFTDLLQALTVIGLDAPIARRFAMVRGDLRRQGQLIPDADIWIGVTAVEYGLTLVTGNRRHFERIPGLQIHAEANP